MQNLNGYIWLTLGWALYFFIHSLLSSHQVKRQIGLAPKTHRILFNCISIVGLLLLLTYNGMIGDHRLLPRNSIFEVVALFLGGGGVLVINATFKQYDIKSFLGRKDETEDLKKSGILAYIRHPIYAGTILAFLGLLFYDPRPATLISTICIFIYLAFGIYLEERKLVEIFGQQYVDYKATVPSLVPDLIKLFKKIT